jgi:hypothetical protein
VIGTCPVCGVDRRDVEPRECGGHDHLEFCPECGMSPHVVPHDSYQASVARLHRAGRQGGIATLAECVVWWRCWGMAG